MLPYKMLSEAKLAEKTVILRVDLNSPIDIGSNGPVLKDTTRIDDHLETTILPLFARKDSPRNIVLLAHQGRLGNPDCTTLRPHFEHCRSRLRDHGIKVFYVWEELDDDEVRALGADAVVSESVLDRIRRLRDRTVLLLENVRFLPSEEKNTADSPEGFAQDPLVKMLDGVKERIVSLDGFSVAHRSQPSVVGLALLGDLYAGPVLAREIQKLSKALQNPEPPMTLIVGGAKADDSLRSIEHFLSNGKAHVVLAGGIVGLVFLLAMGFKANKISLANIERATKNLDSAVQFARELLEHHGHEKIKLPTDIAVGPRNGLAATRRTFAASNFDPTEGHQIGDIGIETVGEFISSIAKSRTIVMNGTLGRYEWGCFARGTRELLRFIGFMAHDRKVHALVGGGDTTAAVQELLQADIAEPIDLCSSGKAFLEVLATGSVESLIGVRILARSGITGGARSKQGETTGARLDSEIEQQEVDEFSLALLRLLGESSLESRLNESSAGDKEFFQRAMPEALQVLGRKEAEVIKLLHHLKELGLVVAQEQVHPNDPSEYLITWSLTDRGLEVGASLQSPRD